MKRAQGPDCDITLVVRTCEDEERIGHVLRRWVGHLRALGLSSEVLIADEGSGDNTLAVVAMLRPMLGAPTKVGGAGGPTGVDLEVLHVTANEGFRAGCERARGRALVICDARTEAPLAPLGFALERLRIGLDVVAVSGRYLVLRRTRAWRAFDALAQRRDARLVEKRFLRRARALGLKCVVTQAPQSSRWAALKNVLRAPLALLS